MTHVYVITGGSGGMGKAIAKEVGSKGTILLADLKEDRLVEAVEELAALGITDVHYQTVDISEVESVKSLAERTKELGSLKAIIHTAGLSPTMADSKRITAVNLIGTRLILDEFIDLAEDGSVAVCIGSMSAHNVPREGPYVGLITNPVAENTVDLMEQFSRGGMSTLN